MATYWEIAAHSASEVFSWCGCLIVSLFFSHPGFWSGNIFLIAPFPDLCLLVPFHFMFQKRENINENGDGPYRGYG